MLVVISILQFLCWSGNNQFDRCICPGKGSPRLNAAAFVKTEKCEETINDTFLLHQIRLEGSLHSHRILRLQQ